MRVHLSSCILLYNTVSSRELQVMHDCWNESVVFLIGCFAAFCIASG